MADRPPEPCIKGRCYSPTACNGWGYCRERNEGREPTAAMQAEFCDEARERAARADACDPRI